MKHAKLFSGLVYEARIRQSVTGVFEQIWSSERNNVIQVTRFDGTKFYLNAELIMSVEGTPDTVITLINNNKFVVKDHVEDVIKGIIHYKRLTHNPDIEKNPGEV